MAGDQRDDQRDELSDADLDEEIRLVGELVVAASAVQRPLTPDEVDAVLGIGTEDPRPSEDQDQPNRPEM